MKTLAAVALLGILALAVPANAQNPQGVTLIAESAGGVAYTGSGAFPVTVSVGCLDLVAAGLTQQSAEPSVTVSLADAPSWINATSVDIPVDPSTCNDPSTAQASGEGSLPFTLGAGAPAVAPATLTLQAALGDDDPVTDDATVTVAYKSSYSLVPSVTFPLTTTNDTTTFTVAGTQASNAMSMIMVDDFSASCGSVSGIGAQQYNNEAGKPDTKTYTVSFNAPEEDWETCTLTLKVYGHYNFDGNVGDPTDHQTITWDIANGGVPETKGGGSKDSPAPVGAYLALGLLGLAAVLRRKA